MCKGSSRPHAALLIHQKSHRTQHTVIFMLILIKAKRYKIKSANGKGTCGQVQRKPGTSFQEFSPGRVTQDLISPATNCDNACAVLSTREAHERLRAQCFYWTLVTKTSSRVLPKFQTLRGKAGVSHKPYCLYEQIKHTEPLFYELWKGRNIPEIQATTCHLRTNLANRPFQGQWSEI